MELLGLIILFTSIGGVLSVLAASGFLFLPERTREKLLPHGISFAIGALLAVAFWGLLPSIFESVKPEQMQSMSAVIMLGLLAFFILEKLLIWRHCHSSSCEAHTEDHIHEENHGSHQHSHHAHIAAGPLIILGDGIHNFVDGILIAAAFLSDVQLGIVTSLAVATHEIPQEVGDFAILLQSGYTRAKALWYNLLASLMTVLGGILAYFGLENMQSNLPYFLAFAASSFIYIAVADLIPSLHKKTELKASLHQIVLIIAGIVLICGMHELVHSLFNHDI